MGVDAEHPRHRLAIVEDVLVRLVDAQASPLRTSSAPRSWPSARQSARERPSLSWPRNSQSTERPLTRISSWRLAAAASQPSRQRRGGSGGIIPYSR
jgi:hypothetical protein